VGLVRRGGLLRRELVRFLFGDAGVAAGAYPPGFPECFEVPGALRVWVVAEFAATVGTAGGWPVGACHAGGFCVSSGYGC